MCHQSEESEKSSSNKVMTFPENPSTYCANRYYQAPPANLTRPQTQQENPSNPSPQRLNDVPLGNFRNYLPRLEYAAGSSCSNAHDRMDFPAESDNSLRIQTKPRGCHVFAPQDNLTVPQECMEHITTSRSTYVPHQFVESRNTAEHLRQRQMTSTINGDFEPQPIGKREVRVTHAALLKSTLVLEGDQDFRTSYRDNYDNKEMPDRYVRPKTAYTPPTAPMEGSTTSREVYVDHNQHEGLHRHGIERNHRHYHQSELMDQYKDPPPREELRPQTHCGVNDRQQHACLSDPPASARSQNHGMYRQVPKNHFYTK